MVRSELVKAVKKSQGVTLIEIMTSMFVFVLIISMLITFFNYFFDSYYFAFQGNRSISEAKFVVDRMSAELRETKKSEEGGYPLVIADDQEVGFYADIDNDGETEYVRYFLNGTQLEKGVIEPGVIPDVYDPVTETTKVVSDYVANGVDPIFFFYNDSWPEDDVNNPLAAADRILDTRLVEISLRVNVSPNQQEDLDLRTKVLLRNLKTNY